MPLTGSERIDDEKIRAISLHHRWHTEAEAPTAKRGELVRMRDANVDKLARIELDVVAHSAPAFLAGLRFQLVTDEGMTRAEADAEIAERVVFYSDKKARLIEKGRLMRAEIDFRDAGSKVDRLAGLEAWEAAQP